MNTCLSSLYFFLLLVCFYFNGFSTTKVLFQDDSLEVKSIEIIGNTSFDENTLLGIIQTKVTPNWFSKLLYKTLGEKFGSKPEYFNSLRWEEDIKRLIEFYHDHGFFEVQIEKRSEIDSINQTIGLILEIQENDRSYIEKIDYYGFENLSSALVDDMLREPLIRIGNYYEKDLIEAEVERILNFLHNNGYPGAKLNYENSAAKHFLVKKHFHLTFAFDTGQQFNFGDTKLTIEPPRDDITPKLILRHLDYKTGDLYSREKQISSERNLNRIDLFETARIEPFFNPESSSNPTVLMNIYIKPKSRNEISPEVGVSDDNNSFNLNLGAGYTNRNFLGDGRTLQFQFRVRTQSIQTWNFHELFVGEGAKHHSVMGAIELHMQIQQPYLFSRFMSGSWTTTLGAEKQPAYVLTILRNKIGINNQFATYTYGLLEWSLERIRPDLIITDTTQREIVVNSLRQEDKPQFNSIINLTLQRDKTNDIFSPTQGFFNSISIEESGVLPAIILKKNSDLPFTQYYKVTVLGRWYRDLTRTRYNILAFKLKSGFQEKYGESRRKDVNIPINRRFFGGGSGGNRGWKARELGVMPPELVQFGGNFIIEGNVEMRVNYLRRYGKLAFIQLKNIWGVYFIDFGNVWRNIEDFRFKDFAVALGIGIRYETFFGPFRLDFGIRVHDPSAPAGKKLIVNKRFFPETLSEGVLHFGIGHAF